MQKGSVYIKKKQYFCTEIQNHKMMKRLLILLACLPIWAAGTLRVHGDRQSSNREDLPEPHNECDTIHHGKHRHQHDFP